MQQDWKHVERHGGSHTALDGKKHSFQSTWYGGLRVSTDSSAAGATARIAVIVQTGCGFLSGGRRDASADEREDCYGRATVALTRAIEHTYIVSSLDMAGMIGMAQTLGVYYYGYFTLKGREIQYHGPTTYPSDKIAVFVSSKITVIPVCLSKDVTGAPLCSRGLSSSSFIIVRFIVLACPAPTYSDRSNSW